MNTPVYRCNVCGTKRLSREPVEKCEPCGGEMSPDGDADFSNLVALVEEYIDLQWIQEAAFGFYFPMPEGAPFPARLTGLLSDNGYLPFVRKRKGLRVCNLLRIPRLRRKPGSKPNITLHVILFLTTLATTTITGYFNSYDMVHSGYIHNIWIGAFTYSLGLLFILGSHEYAHWITAGRNGIQASFPYFIPMIPVISLGTFGAVINIRTPAPDRDALAKLGASGPIAGLITSVIIIFIGLKLSPIVALKDMGGTYITFGEPLFFKLIAYGIQQVPEGRDILLHPLALAGWFGMLVNGFNLLPVGQLDGGQIARAFLPSRYHLLLSYATVCALFIMGIYFYSGWIVLAVLGLLLSVVGNPGAIEEEKPPGKTGKLMAVSALVILLGSFTLQPMKVVEPPRGATDKILDSYLPHRQWITSQIMLPARSPGIGAWPEQALK